MNLKTNIRKQKAFTLIDMMIAIVILAILVTIAYPSYLSFLLQAQRSDALSTLTQYQITLERCYAQNFAYNQNCNALPTFPINSAQGFYSISLSNLATSTYTLTATAIGNQTQDTACASMSINQANVKTAVDASGNAATVCWNPT